MSQYYVIKSKLTGLVLTAEDGGHRPSSKVTPQDQNGQDNQIFYDDEPSGTIRLKSSNFCLDVEDETLVVRPFQQGDPNQQWKRADPHVRNRVDNNRVLDIYRENKDRGAQVGAYKFNGNANQCWSFEYVGGAHHGGGGPAAYPSTYPAYPGYPSAGGAQAGGYPAYPSGGGQVPQQSQGPAKRLFYIVSEMHGKVLDITKEDVNAGAKIIMWKKHEDQKKNQLWYVDNRNFIRSALNDFVPSNTEYGNALEMQPYSENSRFQWKFNGNLIQNGLNEVMDIARENDDNGATVISYKAGTKGKKNQHWRQEFI